MAKGKSSAPSTQSSTPTWNGQWNASAAYIASMYWPSTPTSSGWGSSSGWWGSLPAWFTSQWQYDKYYSGLSASDKAKLWAGWYTASGLQPKPSSNYVAGNKKSYDITNTGNGFSFTSQWPSGWTKTFATEALAKAEIDKYNAAPWVSTVTTPTSIENGYGKLAPADQTERNKKAMEDIAKSWLTIEQYLKEQQWRDTASPEDQKKTTDEMHRLMSEDVLGNATAKDAIELQNKTNEEIAFAKEQHNRQLQIDRLTDANNGIARSENLDKATQQLDALKQSIAYMGTMGMPWVSSTHLDAISKQMDSAQTTYNRLVQTQNNQKAAEAMGNEYNAKAFEKSITDLQYALSQQIGEATQNAINMLQANGNEIDTIEELNTVKGTMMQELDKAVANIAISNATQRKQIVDSYNTNIAKWELWAKNALVVNEQVSKATGFYVDGNGNPMVDWAGNSIKFQPEISSAYDASSWTLIQYDDQGNFKVTQVTAGKWQDITISDRLSIMKYLDEWWDPALAQSILWIDLWFTAESPTSTYTLPSYTPVSKAQWETAFSKVLAESNGSVWGQCWSRVNDYLESMGVGRLYKDPIQQKESIINSQIATKGSVAVIDTWSQYGHVGIVVSENADGSINVKDSNYAWDEKVWVHTFKKSSIKWYFNPMLSSSTATTATPQTTWDMKGYYDPALTGYYEKFIKATLTSADYAALKKLGKSNLEVKQEAQVYKQVGKSEVIQTMKEMKAAAERLKKVDWWFVQSLWGIRWTWTRTDARAMQLLKNRLTLQNFLDIKNKGWTFGAMSDSERDIVGRSATDLGFDLPQAAYQQKLDDMIAIFNKNIPEDQRWETVTNTDIVNPADPLWIF